jgi:hypothetical protein
MPGEEAFAAASFAVENKIRWVNPDEAAKTCSVPNAERSHGAPPIKFARRLGSPGAFPSLGGRDFE